MFGPGKGKLELIESQWLPKASSIWTCAVYVPLSQTSDLKAVANSHVPQQMEDQKTNALTAQTAKEDKVQKKLDIVLVAKPQMLFMFDSAAIQFLGTQI